MFFIIGGDGKEYGPVSADQVREWVKAGRASLEITQGRREGETQLRPLREFLEFHAEAAPLVYAPPVRIEILASRLTRLGCSILDSIIAVAFILPGVALMGLSGAFRPESNTLPPMAIAGIALGALCITVLVVIQCWMIANRGQSMAKRLAGIRIVKFDDYTTPGFVNGVLLRAIIPVVIGYIPGIGPLFSLVDACFIFGNQQRCLHDLMAGTKVIQGQPPSV